MSTRHERRRKAKAKAEAIAQAAIAYNNAAIVRKNMSQPVERNYYAGIKSCISMLEDAGARSGGHGRMYSAKGKIVQGKLVRT